MIKRAKEIQKKWFFSFLFCALLLFTGCAPISKQLRQEAAPLSFSEVSKDPGAYQGKIVIWGGEIIQTTPLEGGTSLLEVVQRPLNWQEKPEKTELPGGRFLVLVERFLDPHIYRTGREVTVAGEILGEKTELIDKMEYRYPFLLCREVYLWRLYGFYYPYSSSYGSYNPLYPEYLWWDYDLEDYGVWGYYLW